MIKMGSQTSVTAKREEIAPPKTSSVDLEKWMTKLSDVKRNTPITTLAIPGSHNSMSYMINSKSEVAPDAESVLKDLAAFAPQFMRTMMRNWSVTQHATIKKQLQIGIRFLDLRISKKRHEVGDDKYYFVHGLFAGQVKPALYEINNFVTRHPKEIVILDFQHFYDFTENDHVNITNLMEFIFQSKICPRPRDLASVSLDWMYENEHNIIIIYRNKFAENHEQYWTSDLWPTPWPDTMDPHHLMTFIRNNLRSRSNDIGLVSQFVLTPQRETVTLNLTSNVKKECAKPVLDAAIDWLKSTRPENLNVAIADFVGLDHCKFPITIVSLNYQVKKK